MNLLCLQVIINFIIVKYVNQIERISETIFQIFLDIIIFFSEFNCIRSAPFRSIEWIYDWNWHTGNSRNVCVLFQTLNNFNLNTTVSCTRQQITSQNENNFCSISSFYKLHFCGRKIVCALWIGVRNVGNKCHFECESKAKSDLTDWHMQVNVDGYTMRDHRRHRNCIILYELLKKAFNKLIFWNGFVFLLN